MTFPDGRIALIGNSACEVGLGKGGEIDAHDHVFRFNNFELSNAVDYGKKTTGWITSFWYDIQPRNLDEFRHIYCPLPLTDVLWFQKYHSMYGHGHNLPLAHQSRDKTEFIPFEYFEWLRMLAQHPSTGLSFIYWLWAENKLADVDIYGFAFFDESVAHHYYEDVRHNGNHSGVLEMLLTKGMQACP